MSSKSDIVHRITKNQSAEVTLADGFISLQFGSKKSSLQIAPLAQWQHVFSNKEKSLTTRIYLFDADFYDPQNPSSTARKLLGQNEILTIGSIRLPLFLGKEVDVSYLDPEHLKIELIEDTIHFTNVSSKPVTITYHQETE
jgi:hypothetical protein